MAVMVRIIIAALQMAGSLIDFEGGFAMAQAFDPLTMTNQATFGRVYELTAMAMLFATNGYQLLIMGLARSLTPCRSARSLTWPTMPTVWCFVSVN